MICDHDEETAPGFWKYYSSVRRKVPHLRELMISISFADDNHHPSLQAADMVAYLARLEAKQRWFGVRHDFKELIDNLTGPRLSGTPTQWKVVWASEEMLRGLKSKADRIAERRGERR